MVNEPNNMTDDFSVLTSFEILVIWVSSFLIGLVLTAFFGENMNEFGLRALIVLITVALGSILMLFYGMKRKSTQKIVEAIRNKEQ